MTTEDKPSGMYIFMMSMDLMIYGLQLILGYHSSRELIHVPHVKKSYQLKKS